MLGFELILPLSAVLLASEGGPALNLVRDGGSAYSIAVASDATPAERHAAGELARFLRESTGASLPIADEAAPARGPRIYVGQGKFVRTALGERELGGLGTDGLIERVVGKDLILVGGRPRGTLYAVYDFLEDVVGCRWWSSKVSTIPKHERLDVPRLNVREVPVLEYREPFWFDAFDGDWAVRNRANGNSEQLDEARGGKHIYQGFVHTFYPLVPPEEHFAKHPEWYSERNGTRSADGGQLCVTNEELTEFVTERVREWLRANPQATIISVSQNDWYGRCECAKCMALEKEEGSPSGPLLHFVNRIAEGIEDEFPNVAVDTLAYQYTRKPPLHVRPRPNVIVRLCSIECDFARPLTDETNKTFADDIRGWNKVSDRLYIWDYTTDFSHYLQPHPNIHALGPNVRFFAENGVKGIFEQGAYQSYGSEMAELRAWVLAKLLWDPWQDDMALVDEFLAGYYGEAGPVIRRYIEMMHDACLESGHYLGCFSSNTAPFLNLDSLSKAEELFDEAEAAVADDPATLDRVRMARQPLNYIWLTRYHEFRMAAALEGRPWSGPDDYAALGREFIGFLKRHDVTKLNEWGTFDPWEAKYASVPRTTPAPPPGCEGLPEGQWLDLQDSSFRLFQEGTLSSVVADPSASDGVAARMPGSTREWAVQVGLAAPEAAVGTKWKCFVVVRCDLKGAEGTAFTCGVYDSVKKEGVLSLAVPVAGTPNGEYRTYLLGELALSPGLMVWLAPDANPDSVDGVSVDRVFLVRSDRDHFGLYQTF